MNDSCVKVALSILEEHEENTCKQDVFGRYRRPWRVRQGFDRFVLLLVGKPGERLVAMLVLSFVVSSNRNNGMANSFLRVSGLKDDSFPKRCRVVASGDFGDGALSEEVEASPFTRIGAYLEKERLR